MVAMVVVLELEVEGATMEVVEGAFQLATLAVAVAALATSAAAYRAATHSRATAVSP